MTDIGLSKIINIRVYFNRHVTSTVVIRISQLMNWQWPCAGTVDTIVQFS